MQVERGKYAEFQKSEYQRRVKKIQDMMGQQGLDAIFSTMPENVYYVTGYKSWLVPISKFRPFATLIKRDGEPIAILPVLEKGDGEGYCWVSDIRYWGGMWGAPVADFIELYTQTMKETGLAKGNIGVELGPSTRMGVPFNDYERLKKNLPDANWKDATSILWDVRKIKADVEIERIQEACRITDKSIEAVWKNLKAGQSERDILRVLGRTMMEEGADAPLFTVIRTGHDGDGMGNKMATDRTVKTGDFIHLDVGALYKDYVSDMIRSACIGTPDPEEMKAHKLALRYNEGCRAAVKPGCTIADIDNARVQMQKEDGITEYAFAGVGHGLGITAHELPRVGPGSTEKVENGFVFTIEPGIGYGFMGLNRGSWFVEDVVMMTSSGRKDLTHADREVYRA